MPVIGHDANAKNSSSCRATAAFAARLHNKQLRQIRITSTCQNVLSPFQVLGSNLISPQRLESDMRSLLKQLPPEKLETAQGELNLLN
ncbi:hypothetical protein SAMN06265222_1294 [Neorhodopirellula lusitana]|uniref:Uncharacterized protein n=1 Tax=Neorhodopirellula lusitana TaxID=445327 RepID=A0ABY1QVK0_9BACT|nr:hypothetical protein SAMN06265222_1294 [Neorhodopirellula lusitana]